jgi:hypothetical protein
LEQDKRKRKPVKTRSKIVFTIIKKEAIMPGLNQKGPMGQGPMTGRRMGRCTNFGANQLKSETADKANTEETTDTKTDAQLPEDFLGRGMGYGKGMGMGRGMGFGRGRGGMGRGMGRQNRFRGGN